MYTIPAEEAHCYNLAPRLRSADVQEILAASGSEPLQCLLDGVTTSSPCFSIMHDDVVMGMYGVVAMGPTVGGVWLLGSQDLVTNPFRTEFIRKCRSYAADLFTGYEILGNYVDERNALHIRWLKWMGAHFIRRVPQYGVAQLPFLEFVMIRGMTYV